MKKITDEAQKAFHAGYYFKKGNTEVIIDNDKGERRFYLHGHCIAKKVLGNGLYLSHCGWKTNTTKERLNGILDAYRSAWIHQKDFTWYLVKNEKETLFLDGWNKIE